MLEPKAVQLVAGSAVLGLLLATGAAALAGPWDSGQRTAERVRASARPVTGGADHGPGAPGSGPGDRTDGASGDRTDGASGDREDGASGDRRPGPAAVPSPAPSAAAVLAALRPAPAAPSGKPEPGTSGRTPAPGERPAAGKPPAGLAALLDPLLADPALGPRHTAVVVDAVTGKELYGKGAADPMTPASTAKLATAAAALGALGPDHRIPTTVVAAPDGRSVTLVGGGDPTLDRPRLTALARDTARALRARKITGVRLSYDTSRYRGPERHPIGPNENLAPISPLMTDEGRLDGSAAGPAPRSDDPAGDTARSFAALLTEAGVRTEGPPAHAGAPRRATTLASTLSAPLSALVERALTESDNDLAEALARATVLAAGRPAALTATDAAVRGRLAGLGLPLAGTRFGDGSGLDRGDRVSARLLAGLLARAADPRHPELRPILTGLPVGGFTGTLKDRYSSPAAGAGLIRAKTGTLTGVNALAGTVVGAGGRLLAFAFLADGTDSPDAAQAALDRLAAALAPAAASAPSPPAASD
ncbi:D-alanyl-D-alanine carboxypeptidase/D-alanyl-D-alanine-endopeptidase [Streptomyces sp. LP05-1]|uniref:D-alanyl-D-alanine carboxypeptidase/D-alanyl-D-alanine-endopeptidase n=1 Tax=Streptomyces pyxinae TaxID=2970734 RepID=A0ABT2CNK8_9ACTN|nr:D-alanyl-D-alanine carboxypeptidase/D-alanyl-D-alanine-endopeptidase [Streptomyces sp. LP05-1]MCS0639023.1 D-alanyl-D-alanine carboxypeptidase/D-alanyl-D-alanine-endopeptidase [Streptomyces sp. LP05-1]